MIGTDFFGVITHQCRNNIIWYVHGMWNQQYDNYAEWKKIDTDICATVYRNRFH